MDGFERESKAPDERGKEGRPPLVSRNADGGVEASQWEG